MVVEKVSSLRRRLENTANIAFLPDRTSLSLATPKWGDGGGLNFQWQERSAKCEWILVSFFNKNAKLSKLSSGPNKVSAFIWFER